MSTPSAPQLFPPPLSVLLGPAGSGKTSTCLGRFRAASGHARLLVPTKTYAEKLQARLAEGASHASEHAAHIEVFGDYVKKLAKTKGECVRRSFQRQALTEIFEREIGPDGYFGKMRGAPGFPGALAEIIRDLKLSGVTPQELREAVPAVSKLLDDEAFARRGDETARIYQAYEEFLSGHDLCDEEDLPLLAARAVETAKELPAVLFVDGFYRLSCVWRDFLAALARRGVAVTVSLPYDEARPLLFASPMRTLEALRAEFDVTVEVLPPAASPQPEALRHLERNLFAPNAAVAHIAGPSPLEVFDAPNAYTEAEMVARALRREHDENGIAWDRCAIVLRTVGDYAPILSAALHKYEVPVAMQQALPVADNPLVRTIATLCGLFLDGWPRDAVIEYLKSSYTPIDKVRADGLRLRARRRAVRQGRAAWERMATSLREKGDYTADHLELMLQWDGRLLEAERTAEEFAGLIEEMCAALQLDKPKDAGDRVALGHARAVMQDYASNRRMNGDHPMPFSRFFYAVLQGWKTASYTPPAEGEAARMIDAYDSRQLDARVVAVMGLVERVFPKRIAEDPFFRDDERTALKETAGIDLDLQAERADDERLLFYMAVSAPSDRLILSFPRSSEESDTLPSFYLDEVRALFDHVPTEIRTLADVAPRPEECVSGRDSLLAACAVADEAEDPATVAPVMETRVRPPAHRVGVEAGVAYATPRHYSITELETYNTCPLQHFLRYGLKVRALSEGGGPADKGSLFHAAVRRAFRGKPEGARLTAEQLDALVRAEFEACLQDYPLDAKPYVRLMLERALTDVFPGFAEREERYGQLFGFAPAYFELAFGQDERPSETEAEAPRDYDPASTSQPLVVDFGDGTPPAYVCGTIDRVDIAADGQTALVLDYKLGSTHEWPKLKEGKSLQIPLYMLAVEQLWGLNGAVGCYDSPRDKGRRRFARRDQVDARVMQPVAGVEDGRMAKPVSADEYDEMMRAVRDAVRRAVRGIAAGRILPAPGDHCRYCDYGDVCRTDRDGIHDGEPLPE